MWVLGHIVVGFIKYTRQGKSMIIFSPLPAGPDAPGSRPHNIIPYQIRIYRISIYTIRSFGYRMVYVLRHTELPPPFDPFRITSFRRSHSTIPSVVGDSSSGRTEASHINPRPRPPHLTRSPRFFKAHSTQFCSLTALTDLRAKSPRIPWVRFFWVFVWFSV